MSRDAVPFFLREAVITLYPAAADGSSLTDVAVWSGALANQLKLRSSLETMKLMGSGQSYATEHHLDEEHLIEIERTWILRKAAPIRDFMPGRNQQYVLEIVWQADGVWYKRTYLGVTGRSVELSSHGTNQFAVEQAFRAQRFQETDGTTGPPIYTPTPQAQQSIGFFREDPFVNGEYLLGSYRWASNVVLNSALVIGSAGQGAPTVLTLELGGVLTDRTVTIAEGAANVEVTATANLGGIVAVAGQSVRWQITSGPAPESAMWLAALTMQVN